MAVAEGPTAFVERAGREREALAAASFDSGAARLAAQLAAQREAEAAVAREGELQRGGQGVRRGIHLWHRALVLLAERRPQLSRVAMLIERQRGVRVSAAQEAYEKLCSTAWPTPAKSWEAVASQFPPPALLWAAEAEICMASNGRLKDAPFRPAFGSESPRSSRTTHVTPGPGAYYTPARIGSSQFRQPLPRAAPAVSSTPMRLRAHSAGRARMPASPRPGSAARCSESRDTAWRPGPPPNSRKSRAVRGARAVTPARVERGTSPTRFRLRK